MLHVVVDVEADGPYPGDYSMVSVGAIVAEPSLDRTFYIEVAPISPKWDPEALAISNISREQHQAYMEPIEAMHRFDAWLESLNDKRLMFVSDNNGYDWQWVNYYLWKYAGRNLFGHSSTNMGSLYKGFMRDMTKNFKHLRDTRHSHNALDDARGNAEAFLKIQKGLYQPRHK